MEDSTKSPAYYYTINIMLILYAIGFAASLVLVQNAHVVHTYHKGNVNGVLYSNRFTSMYWVALVLCVCRLWTFITVNSMILYRNTRGCTVFWSALLVLCVTADYLALAILGANYRNCNGIDQVDNPCNDYKWCCVEAVYAIGSNLCGNTCTPFVAASTLTANVDFLWLFWTTVVFCLFDLVFLLMPLGMWLSNTAGAGGSTATLASSSDVLDEAEQKKIMESVQLSAVAKMTKQT